MKIKEALENINARFKKVKYVHEDAAHTTIFFEEYRVIMAHITELELIIKKYVEAGVNESKLYEAKEMANAMDSSPLPDTGN